MSYDLRVSVKAALPRFNGDPYIVVGIPEDDSPTYNLRAMFVASTGWDYKQGEQYPATEALPLIRHGIEELSRHTERYVQYEPSNGWGSTESALSALTSWADCIEEHAADWPLEALYVSW